MRSKAAQVSLFDTYKNVADSYETNKPRLFSLLDELIDWDALIPQRFFSAFYQAMGRPRVYGLVSFLKMLVLQRIFGYTADSQLLVTLRHSMEMRDFCELKKVPDAAKLTRFKQEFQPYIRRFVSQRSETKPVFSIFRALTPSWMVGCSSRPRSAWLRWSMRSSRPAFSR